MELLKDYFRLQQEIYDYFGYVEDWKVIPLDDCTDYYWKLIEHGDGRGEVMFAEGIEALDSDGDYYVNSIYTQRFLPKWVYRGKDYTMICLDTHVDGNKLLRVFDNKKEHKKQEEYNQIQEDLFEI